MKISKKDALMWFEFFASLPDDEELTANAFEIVFSTFAQIEAVIERKHEKLLSEIKGLKSLENRTYFVGNEEKFAKGCRSCLTGTGLTAIRKTNKCNIFASNKFFINHATVLKSVDKLDSKSSGEIRAGSSPASGTIKKYLA